jgi:hypothetical protein
MTEAEWLDCDSARSMLLDLAKGDLAQKHRLLALGYYFPGKGIIRPKLDWKLLSFACACYRRVWSRLKDQRMRTAVEVVERFLDKKASREEMLAAGGASPYSAWGDSGWCAAWYGCKWGVDFAVDRILEQKEQVKLLHDVLGNPFRPASLHRSWLNWNSRLLVSMAQTMYDSRDFIDMPIMADALEEAGCTDTDILNHCRQPGEHVRGCWVIDFILGKE